MSDFQPGDVVQLRSGGPLMTVHNLGLGHADVHCAWVHGAQPGNGAFPAVVLRKVPPSKDEACAEYDRNKAEALRTVQRDTIQHLTRGQHPGVRHPDVVYAGEVVPSEPSVPE